MSTDENAALADRLDREAEAWSPVHFPEDYALLHEAANALRRADAAINELKAAQQASTPNGKCGCNVLIPQDVLDRDGHPQDCALRAASVSPAPVDQSDTLAHRLSLIHEVINGTDTREQAFTSIRDVLLGKYDDMMLLDAARSTSAESAATGFCSQHQYPNAGERDHDPTCRICFPVSPLGALPTDEQIAAEAERLDRYYGDDAFVDGAKWARSFTGTMPSREQLADIVDPSAAVRPLGSSRRNYALDAADAILRLFSAPEVPEKKP